MQAYDNTQAMPHDTTQRVAHTRLGGTKVYAHNSPSPIGHQKIFSIKERTIDTS